MKARGKNTVLPDPDRFAEGAVLVSQAEAEGLPDRRPNQLGRPVRFKIARYVERQPDSGQVNNLADAPLGSTRAKKGRGSGG